MEGADRIGIPFWVQQEQVWIDRFTEIIRGYVIRALEQAKEDEADDVLYKPTRAVARLFITVLPDLLVPKDGVPCFTEQRELNGYTPTLFVTMGPDRFRDFRMGGGAFLLNVALASSGRLRDEFPEVLSSELETSTLKIKKHRTGATIVTHIKLRECDPGVEAVCSVRAQVNEYT